jgi:hypothetical protein
MKLTQIILPEAWHIRPAHLWLQHQLIERWNGYTAMPNSTGMWKDDDGNGYFEPVTVYMVAMERADVIHLREVAAEVARLGDQQCVMIVTPQGDVEFIKPAREQP